MGVMQLLQCTKSRKSMHNLLMVTQKGPNSKKNYIGGKPS